MRLCVYATTFQADIQAFTLFAAAQPGGFVPPGPIPLAACQRCSEW